MLGKVRNRYIDASYHNLRFKIIIDDNYVDNLFYLKNKNFKMHVQSPDSIRLKIKNSLRYTPGEHGLHIGDDFELTGTSFNRMNKAVITCNTDMAYAILRPYFESNSIVLNYEIKTELNKEVIYGTIFGFIALSILFATVFRFHKG